MRKRLCPLLLLTGVAAVVVVEGVLAQAVAVVVVTLPRGRPRVLPGPRAVVVVTHYQRLLDYIVPDHVHVLKEGQIVKSGDKNLALELEERGYAEFGAA